MTKNTPNTLQQTLSQALELIENIEKGLYAGQNLQKLVRKRYPDWPLELYGLVCEQTELRQKALKKFSKAEQMLFTRKSLEQSTSEILSIFTSNLFENKKEVLEVCSGIGGNTIGLIQHFQKITTVEPDLLLNAIHEHNLKLYAPNQSIVRLHENFDLNFITNFSSIFIDPDRRINGQRKINIQDYQPNIYPLLENLHEQKECILKLSPLLNKEETAKGFSCLFLAEGMELKQNLWCKVKTSRPLPEYAIAYHNSIYTDKELLQISKEITKEKQFYELNPSVLKARCHHTIAEHFGLELLVESSKYMTGYSKNTMPYAKSYTILAEEPYHEKTLKRFLSTFINYRFEFKTQGIEEQEIRKLQNTYRQPSAELLTIFILKRKGFNKVYICKNN